MQQKPNFKRFGFFIELGMEPPKMLTEMKLNKTDKRNPLEPSKNGMERPVPSIANCLQGLPLAGFLLPKGALMRTLTPGQLVKIIIKRKSWYTSDLYGSIQGRIGEIIQRQSDFSLDTDAYLIKFDLRATRKYAKTHGGKWSGTNLSKPMAWWTEREDFILVKDGK